MPTNGQNAEDTPEVVLGKLAAMLNISTNRKSPEQEEVAKNDRGLKETIDKCIGLFRQRLCQEGEQPTPMETHDMQRDSVKKNMARNTNKENEGSC